MANENTRVRRRERKNITSGVAHVNSTFNNTLITITDAQGNAISWSSAGSMGFIKPIEPAEDQLIALPCASVMVISVLLKVELTCATPEVMFLRSRRRTRVFSFAIYTVLSRYCFLPAMALAKAIAGKKQ